MLSFTHVLIVLCGREITLEQGVGGLVGGATVQLMLSLNYHPLITVDQALDNATHNLHLPASNTGRYQM